MENFWSRQNKKVKEKLFPDKVCLSGRDHVVVSLP